MLVEGAEWIVTPGKDLSLNMLSQYGFFDIIGVFEQIFKQIKLFLLTYETNLDLFPNQTNPERFLV